MKRLVATYGTSLEISYRNATVYLRRLFWYELKKLARCIAFRGVGILTESIAHEVERPVSVENMV